MKLGVAKQKKVKVDTVNKELPLPSDKFVASSGTGFSIQIPDNFVPNKSGNTYYVSGSRRSDCSMQIDIVPHKGKQLNKIAEEFEASYGKNIFWDDEFDALVSFTFNFNLFKVTSTCI